MTKAQYIRKASEALEAGIISQAAYETMLDNADVIFEDDDRMPYGLPAWYAEIEYTDMDTPEAIAGARFDDINYSHYLER